MLDRPDHVSSAGVPIVAIGTEAQGGQVTGLRTSQWSSLLQLDDKALTVTDFPCLAPRLREETRFEGDFLCVYV